MQVQAHGRDRAFGRTTPRCIEEINDEITADLRVMLEEWAERSAPRAWRQVAVTSRRLDPEEELNLDRVAVAIVEIVGRREEVALSFFDDEVRKVPRDGESFHLVEDDRLELLLLPIAFFVVAAAKDRSDTFRIGCRDFRE